MNEYEWLPTSDYWWCAAGVSPGTTWRMEPSACPSHGLKTPALYKARDSNILRPSGGQLTAEKMYPKGPEGPKIWFIENKQHKAHLSQSFGLLFFCTCCCGPWLEIVFGENASSDGESVSSTVL